MDGTKHFVSELHVWYESRTGTWHGLGRCICEAYGRTDGPSETKEEAVQEIEDGLDTHQRTREALGDDLSSLPVGRQAERARPEPGRRRAARGMREPPDVPVPAPRGKGTEMS